MAFGWLEVEFLANAGSLVLAVSGLNGGNDPAVVISQPVSQSGVVVLDGQSFTAGDIPSTVSSTHIAICTNGDLIPGNSTIHNIPPTAIPASVSCFNIDREKMTLSAAHLLAEGKTFAGGDQDPTIDRKVVSLDSTALQNGTSNVPLGLESSPLPSVVTLAAVQMVWPVASGVLVECATLTSNGLAVTITGTQLSFRNGGLVTRTSTVPITLPASQGFFFDLDHSRQDGYCTLKRRCNCRFKVDRNCARHYELRNNRIRWK